MGQIKTFSSSASSPSFPKIIVVKRHEMSNLAFLNSSNWPVNLVPLLTTLPNALLLRQWRDCARFFFYFPVAKPTSCVA